jgi:hypothetical protein
MVPRIKELLVIALRSGKYRQAVGRMKVTSHSGSDVIERSGIGHCCLGVLTEIAIEDGILDKFSVNNRGQCPLVMVKEWAGISDPVQGHLMTMNDGRPSQESVGKPLKNKDRKTFGEIATWIEHNL